MISQIGKTKATNNLSIDLAYLFFFGKRHAGSRKAGFTLIELVLVALIISILIGLSTPLFRNTFSDLQLKNTAFNLAKLINYTREMAIIESTNYRINMNFKKREFWVTKLDSSGDEAVYKRIGGRYGKFFSLPEGLILKSKKNKITFYPDGRSNEAEIKIITKTGEGRLLHVKGFGTEIEIKDIVENEDEE